VSTLRDAIDAWLADRGVTLDDLQRRVADAYDRRNKVGDARYLDHQPDWTAPATITRHGLR
jgi:hypothetical protein